MRFDGEHLGTYTLKAIKCREWCPEEEVEEDVV